VRVNGKVRDRVVAAADAPEADVLTAAEPLPGVAKYLEGRLAGLLGSCSQNGDNGSSKRDHGTGAAPGECADERPQRREVVTKTT
jgi:hypothetical protein